MSSNYTILTVERWMSMSMRSMPHSTVIVSGSATGTQVVISATTSVTDQGSHLEKPKPPSHSESAANFAWMLDSCLPGIVGYLSTPISVTITRRTLRSHVARRLWPPIRFYLALIISHWILNRLIRNHLHPKPQTLALMDPQSRQSIWNIPVNRLIPHFQDFAPV